MHEIVRSRKLEDPDFSNVTLLTHVF